MLYFISSKFISTYGFLRVFESTLVRGMIAFFVSLMFVIVFGNYFISYLKKIKVADKIRKEGPTTHFSKEGTPTMGGIMIILAIVIAMIFSGNFNNKFTIFLVSMTILFTSIGFTDDYFKLTKSKKGLSAKLRLLLETFMSGLAFLFIYKYGLVNKEIDFSIINPLIKNSYIYIGAILFLIFVILVVVGTSNAVNLTDGLDGLVSGPILIVSILFLVVAYLEGHREFSKYLNIYYIKGASEIAVYLSSVIGAMLGFLWYNFYPAQVFMGDTGSLTLGGMLGMIAIFLKQELLLPIAGFIFIVEVMSDIIQIFYYKKYKKRVFKMAPIHHHFELSGMSETKVTIRFWIVTIITCVIAFIILKLR
ncbi:phospho-N-acetylmuramoyl-pentapeptide-transferase [Oceanivirga miroungae]|uniref:Phospho-N-acetylmuramoyl-pentapeptide-transferase n=1 Tax=Oceanivirga miroungae TaxID=1130046 RepID=A0A6I8MFC8_9FUSO|nr:phospho-N-acetylmuramoyl-pentapeptide-transferase [Oceanivirga miroungae]VWL85797.1 phospho-N-acetylmuramoyl-pentapeptide-transferase [Oceanivirga miroungae]